MRKFILLAVSLTIITFNGFALEIDSLCGNNDFEDGLLQWKYDTLDGAIDLGFIGVQNADVQSGDSAIYIKADMQHNWKLRLETDCNGIDLDSNSVYTFSYWAKYSGGAPQPEIKVVVNSESSNTITAVTENAIAGTWTKYSFEFSPDSSYNNAWIRISFRSVGEYYFDNVQMERRECPNGGFESDLFGWKADSMDNAIDLGAIAVTDTNVYSGTKALSIQCDEEHNFKLNVESDGCTYVLDSLEEYQISFWARYDGDSVAELKPAVRSSFSNTIDTKNFSGITGTWTQYTSTFVSDSNYTGVTIRLSARKRGAYNIDDVELLKKDCNGDFGGTAYFDTCGTCVGGASGNTDCALTSVTENILEEQVKINPNPSSGSFNVQLPVGLGDAGIFVYALNGQLLSSTSASNAQVVLGQELDPGVYLIKIVIGSAVVTKRAIKL